MTYFTLVCLWCGRTVGRLVGRSGGRSGGRSVGRSDDYQNVSGAEVTKFYYPWCSASRARELLYYALPHKSYLTLLLKYPTSIKYQISSFQFRYLLSLNINFIIQCANHWAKETKYFKSHVMVGTVTEFNYRITRMALYMQWFRVLHVAKSLTTKHESSKSYLIFRQFQTRFLCLPVSSFFLISHSLNWRKWKVQWCHWTALTARQFRPPFRKYAAQRYV